MEETYPVLPQFLKFRSNDNFGQLVWNEAIQGLEIYPLYDEKFEQPLQPTRLEWKAFWLLLEHAGVWNWQPHYAPEGGLSCDEHQWSLMVSKDGRFVSTCGNEAYPGTHEKHYEEGSPYDVLRTAVEVLTCRHYDSSMVSDEAPPALPESFDFTLWADAYENLGVNIRWRKNGPGLQWQHVSHHEDQWIELPSPSRLTWKAFCLLVDRQRSRNGTQNTLASPRRTLVGHLRHRSMAGASRQAAVTATHNAKKVQAIFPARHSTSCSLR